MQVQWVCSREQRIALCKRSSINHTPWKYKDKLAYLCSVHVNHGLTNAIKRGSFFHTGEKLICRPQIIGASKLDWTQHAIGLAQHTFDAPVKNRKAPTEVNNICRRNLGKTKWISPVTDRRQALRSSQAGLDLQTDSWNSQSHIHTHVHTNIGKHTHTHKHTVLILTILVIYPIWSNATTSSCLRNMLFWAAGRQQPLTVTQPDSLSIILVSMLHTSLVKCKAPSHNA